MVEQSEMPWRGPAMEQAVRQYLADRPDAMDTLEGIAEWWLTRERIRIELQTLMSVINRLTDEGVLERIGSGDEARYRLKNH